MLSSNPWRYFYEFLHRSDRGCWSSNVERDFGGRVGLSFDEWWDEVSDWFKPMEQWTLMRIESAEEFTHWHLAEMPEVTVTINLTQSRRKIIEELTALLDELAPPRPGKPPFVGWTVSDYHLVAEPDCAAMDNFLRAWDLKNRESVKTLYEIGVRLGIGAHTIQDKDSEHVATAKTQAMTALVSKYLKRADQIIKGCEKGLFPAVDDNPIDPSTS